MRFYSADDFTLGLLFDVTDGRRFLCYTLEDEFRSAKVAGETRIPEGKFSITLRKEGGRHQRYSERFASIHKGMLWVRDVPDFEYVLFHVGNDDDDTAGCILVGDSSDIIGFTGKSLIAYRRVYPPIAEALENDEPVTLYVRKIA